MITWSNCKTKQKANSLYPENISNYLFHVYNYYKYHVQTRIIINLIYKIMYFQDRLIRLETGGTNGYLADDSLTK